MSRRPDGSTPPNLDRPSLTKHSLTKHHGLGNDFLVLLTDLWGDTLPLDAADAVRLCDRRRGIGADGLIVGRRGVGPDPDAVIGLERPFGPTVTMTLFNADGSRAEMSGNGVRCLAHAEARHRQVDELDLAVVTDGGLRWCEVRPGPEPFTCTASVAMGLPGDGPTAGPADPDAGLTPVTKQLAVDLGNPHLVLLVDAPALVDLGREGPAHERRYPAGINVEFIAPTAGATDELDLRVWERGAGITEACGTGAAAAAHAAHEWGLVGRRVTVHMPGGDAEILVGGDEGIKLVGPATFVARIELP
ncbi:diaminopimelate epimerase [soil metagenome]